MAHLGFRYAVVFVVLALASTFTTETVSAQEVINNGLTTYFGEDDGPIRIIEPDGSVSEVAGASIHRIILVQKKPPLPRPPADEPLGDDEVSFARPIIIAPPVMLEEDIDLSDPESVRRLEEATRRFLNRRTVPQLPGYETAPARSVPAPELADIEAEAAAAIEQGLVRNNVPVIPRYVHGRRIRVEVSDASDIVQASETVRTDLQRQVVPPLPESQRARIARGKDRAAKRNGLSGGELRAQTPLHLLQQPPPRLPESNKRKY